MPKLKAGFTLIELVIVLAVFAILMLAGTQFFLEVIQNSAQATIRNEVRQNANSVLQKFKESIRAGKCINVTVNSGVTTVIVYSTTGCTTEIDRYQFRSDGVVYWQPVSGSYTPISSAAVAFLDCGAGACGGSTCSQGATFANTGNITGAVNFTLTVQQAVGITRADQCARISLPDSATPRQY